MNHQPSDCNASRLDQLNIDAGALLATVEREGSLCGRFLFLNLASCAIATLGLLLNSSAVVIGAMLVAPLLSPIVRLGFALPRNDLFGALRSLSTAAVGAVTALAVSILIIRLAPAMAPTAEIMARTQPNLLDLLVAVISGLAGGYAVIRGLNGVFAGVAIATALMPPLASCGYGLAWGDMAIAQGAALLFVANLTAIALGVAAVAAWAGLYAPRLLPVKALAAMAVLAALAIPMTHTMYAHIEQQQRIQQ